MGCIGPKRVWHGLWASRKTERSSPGCGATMSQPRTLSPTRSCQCGSAGLSVMKAPGTPRHCAKDSRFRCRRYEYGLVPLMAPAKREIWFRMTCASILLRLNIKPTFLTSRSLHREQNRTSSPASRSSNRRLMALSSAERGFAFTSSVNAGGGSSGGGSSKLRGGLLTGFLRGRPISCFGLGRLPRGWEGGGSTGAALRRQPRE